MPPIPRVTACSAVLDGRCRAGCHRCNRSHSRRRRGGRNAGADGSRVTPMRIRVLVADGRRLAWGDGFQRIQVFDRVTHRATTVARDPWAYVSPRAANPRKCWGPFCRQPGPFACEGGSNTGVDGDVFTAALDHRRARRLRGFGVSREAGMSASSYGPPVRIAGGGGTLASTALTVPGNARMPVSGASGRGGGRLRAALCPPRP